MSMNKILFCLCLLVLPMIGNSQSNLEKEIFERWVNAAEYTSKVAMLMPLEQVDFRPTAEQMSFREQFIHVMKNITFLSSKYILEEENPFVIDENMEWDSALQLFEKVIAYGNHAIEFGFTEPDQVVEFFAGPKTKRQIILLLNEHQTHHRGQMIVYLRLHGIQPPKYIGW